MTDAPTFAANTEPALSQKDKIQILLSEYSALRSEINSRTGYGFQLIAIASVAAAWLLQHPIDQRFLIGICLLIIVISLAVFIDFRDLSFAVLRVRKIEMEINERVGERLLVWDSIWGGWQGKFWTRQFWAPRPPAASN